MTSLTNLSEGTKIGYNPVGAPDERDVGIVKRVDEGVSQVIVTAPDDPGIEEKVPFENVKSVEATPPGEHFGVSPRDRVEALRDAIDDVPGVTPTVRGIGDMAYLRVDVAFDYGDRHEIGDGNVAVAPDSDEPVGRAAFEHGFRICRVHPFPERESTGLWFATAEDYVAAGGDE